MHDSCTPTLMTPDLRRDMEQLIAALRCRADIGRNMRARVDRVAIAMGAK